MRRLTGSDVFMLRSDHGGNYNHGVKLAILDPSDDPRGWSFERFRELLAANIAAVPLLRMRVLGTPLGLHRPTWVDDPEFNLDTHIRRVACPAPGGWEQFTALVEDAYCHRLDASRPMWELWVVEGLDDGRVAMLALLHHAYTDGSGAFSMVEDFFAAAPSDDPGRRESPTPASSLPSVSRRIGCALRDLPGTLSAVPAAVRGIVQRARLESELAESQVEVPPSFADRTAPVPFQHSLSRGRTFSCRSFPLEDLKRVRAGLGGTINDVFLSCVSGSIREHLLARDAAPEAAMIGTMAFLTKPVHERPGLGGNYSTVRYIWLHSQIEDPLERYEASRVSADATKKHFKQTRSADPLDLAEFVPGAAFAALAHLMRATDGRYSMMRNVGLSNVPGPREPLYLGRWRVDEWFSNGQLAEGLTLSYTAWSYADQFNLCVLADSAQVPSATELVDSWQRSLQELLDLVSQPRPATRS